MLELYVQHIIQVFNALKRHQCPLLLTDCPRSWEAFHTVCYDMILVKTSWTYRNLQVALVHVFSIVIVSKLNNLVYASVIL